MLMNNDFNSIFSKTDMFCRVCVGLPYNCYDIPLLVNLYKPTRWLSLGAGVCISEGSWFTSRYFCMLNSSYAKVLPDYRCWSFIFFMWIFHLWAVGESSLTFNMTVSSASVAYTTLQPCVVLCWSISHTWGKKNKFLNSLLVTFNCSSGFWRL